MLSPLSDKEGKPVDWWFIYKLPMKVGPKKDSTGFEFLYLDSESKGPLGFSDTSLDQDNSALSLTLNELFSKKSDYGYVAWNDEIPPTQSQPKPKNKGNKGHSKGILAFSKAQKSGWYLLHSTPRFPAIGETQLPEDERKYGQTYLCVSLDYDSINQVAKLIQTQNEGQVYGSELPEVNSDEAIYALANGTPFSTPSQPASLDLKTRAGMPLKFITKNKAWSEVKSGNQAGKDFWKDLVGPELGCNMDVETWRRGLVFGDQDAGQKDKTMDVVDLNLEKAGFKGYGWTYDQDHSKWGFACETKSYWVVVADINRQLSQENRGGGGLAFEHFHLWNFLSSISIPEKKFETQTHKDIA
ncbi:deoxyribonuclease II family protein [Algoriphagus taiwanensis]|uniref:Deoxyribonuclease II family protein n=1 Tax=Algoriphagus taiwanensis TaxID=1445656 RepID=A0ABQ6Q320_9BACT|nr:deoxyribonuclease II family protein [Algoriphagus taiwanensis]